jgi:hypothetical protein
MGQGDEAVGHPFSRAGLQPGAHRGRDPCGRSSRHGLGTADKPRVVEPNLCLTRRLLQLARFEGLELRIVVAASSRGRASLRRRFSITCFERFGSELEARRPVEHGAADHDHLLFRHSRPAGSAGALALCQVSPGSAHHASSVAGTTPGGRRGIRLEIASRSESTAEDAIAEAEVRAALGGGPPRLAQALGHARLGDQIELAPATPLSAESDLLRDRRRPRIRDRRLGRDLPAVGPARSDQPTNRLWA